MSPINASDEQHQRRLRRTRDRSVILRRYAPLIALMCSALNIATAGATSSVYKWTDANGKTHFDDHPPVAHAEQIIVPVAPATITPSEVRRRERTARMLDAYAIERKEKAEVRAKAAEAAKQRRQQCEQAKKLDFEIQHAGYLFVRDKSGAKQVLSEAEHKKARAEMTAKVAALCQ